MCIKTNSGRDRKFSCNKTYSFNALIWVNLKVTYVQTIIHVFRTTYFEITTSPYLFFLVWTCSLLLWDLNNNKHKEKTEQLYLYHITLKKWRLWSLYFWLVKKKNLYSNFDYCSKNLLPLYWDECYQLLLI